MVLAFRSGGLAQKLIDFGRSPAGPSDGTGLEASVRERTALVSAGSDLGGTLKVWVSPDDGEFPMRTAKRTYEKGGYGADWVVSSLGAMKCNRRPARGPSRR